MVHLMSAGRIRYLTPRASRPEDAGLPAPLRRRRRAHPHRGRDEEAAGSLAPPPGRALCRARAPRPRGRPLTPASLDPILAADGRRLHSLLRDQRAIAGIGRAWANEILHAAPPLPLRALDPALEEETERLAAAIRAELARGLELRLKGADNATTYRVHDRLGEPCWRCHTPLARIDFEEHTIYYCPVVPDRWSPAQRPAPLEAPAVTIEEAHECRTRSSSTRSHRLLPQLNEARSRRPSTSSPRRCRPDGARRPRR